MHDLLVEQTGAARRRRQHPQYEQDLDLVVERKPREEHVQECLHGGEQREHYPIHHPFDLVCFIVVVGIS